MRQARLFVQETPLLRLNRTTKGKSKDKEPIEDDIYVESHFEVFGDVDDDVEVFSDVESDIEDNEGFIDEEVVVLQSENERFEDLVDDDDLQSFNVEASPEVSIHASKSLASQSEQISSEPARDF
jgi:hypothetical protein